MWETVEDVDWTTLGENDALMDIEEETHFASVGGLVNLDLSIPPVHVPEEHYDMYVLGYVNIYVAEYGYNWRAL